MNRFFPVLIKITAFSMTAFLIVGCPPSNNGDYDSGYADGFFTDSKYWEGYADSYDTAPPNGPILYSGSDIPHLEDGSYDAGYYDGLWYAYNDGYFVSYDYGFTIGFSEGYDIGYSEFWYDFLINDAHPEFLDGSFMDGYQDGFSEGSIFGASDYEADLVFDWEDAMWDYRSGTDLYIEAVGFGTGEYGDVYLYEYGTDPNDLIEKTDAAVLRKSDRTACVRIAAAGKDVVSARVSVEKATQPLKQSSDISYRPLTNAVRAQLNMRPLYSPRFNGRSLALPDTWLERIERYRAERQ